MKIDDEDNQNKYNEKFETKKAKAVRHLLLIRHGQYHTERKTDAEKVLTELGMIQQVFTINNNIKTAYKHCNYFLFQLFLFSIYAKMFLHNLKHV